MIRVLLADDQTLVRAGFRSILDGEDDISVITEAADGEDAVQLAHDLQPDVVLMDIRMPELDGLEATRRIVADARLAGVKVVILTTFDLDDYVYSALRAGASGFLVKDAEPMELIHGVRPQMLRMPPEEDLPPGPRRRFVGELFVLYRKARRPTLREINEQIMRMDLAGTASRETIRRMLQGVSVPANWETVEAVLTVLCDRAGITPKRCPLGGQ